MSRPLMPLVSPTDLLAAGPTKIDASTQQQAAAIVDDVRQRGEAALRSHAERLGDLAPGAPLWHDRAALAAALETIPPPDHAVLARTAERIRAFALAQRRALLALDSAVPGGRAGHHIAPVERAGCYAPGGRYPLPSSVLMTAVTARAAGVRQVVVASPKPPPIVLAAAAIADADGLLACGGAQAIAALAHGAGPVPRCDVVVGPGNQFVTAAKRHVAGDVGIDLLAGPSELVVLADDSADPELIAADLLAQAEHDVHARPILIAIAAPTLPTAVEAELAKQLQQLPTAVVARQGLAAGAATVVPDAPAGIGLCDRLAPEHLQVMTRDAAAIAARLSHYGALFVGARSAEVFGDYGIGPNHVLPTGGAARLDGGLSVLSFLRVRTWLELDHVDAELVADVVRLAELEGLSAHAAAARLRVTLPDSAR